VSGARILAVAVAVTAALAAAACGKRSSPGPAEPMDLPPLPPDSPTVIGALLAHADELALTDAQRLELEQIDRALRDDLRPYEADLAERLDANRPPPGAGPGGPPRGGRGGGGPPMGGGGGGMGGGGMGGGGMGGPPMGGGGMGGGGGGAGMGGPPPSDREPPQRRGPPPDPARAAADRAAIEDLVQTIEKLQRDAQDAALTVLPDTARERGLQVIDEFWANLEARRRNAPIGRRSDGAAP
jgi:hypothetical protein